MLPLNWRLTVPELAYILGDSTPKLLIHDKSFAQQATALSKNLLEIDPDDPASAYERALASGAPALPARGADHDDIGMVMYTSGTTGHPKGAIITHGMVFWNAVNLGIPAMISPQTVQLVVLPLFHTGGLNCYANPVLHAGGTILIMRAFEPGLALDYLSDPALGITHFFGVPAPYQFMMQHPKFQSADLSRLRISGVGGAPCALAILEGWQARGVRADPGLGHDRDQPGRHDARCRRRDPQGGLGRQGDDAHRDPRRRRAGQGRAAGRDRRAADQGSQHHAGLLEQAGGHGGRLHRRLAAYRRRRAARRRGLRLYRRPLEGHVHLGRRERVSGRGRERAVPASRRSPTPRSSACPTSAGARSAWRSSSANPTSRSRKAT